MSALNWVCPVKPDYASSLIETKFVNGGNNETRIIENYNSLNMQYSHSVLLRISYFWILSVRAEEQDEESEWNIIYQVGHFCNPQLHFGHC